MIDAWTEGANTGLVMGLVLGLAATICTYEFVILSNQDQMMEECEKSLPRDKYCILIAIEETKE